MLVLGAFHYAKDSGNFGWKVHFGSFRPEYSGPPREVVHSNRSDRFIALLLFSRFHFCRAFVKGIKMVSHSFGPGLAWFDRKCRSIFPRVFLLVSGRSVWKAPNISECCAGTDKIWANARKRQLIKSNA